MPPSQISAYQAFYMPGVTRVYIADTLANYLSPTRAELDAATTLDVTRQVKEINDFKYEADVLDRPDFASTFTSTVGGRTKAGNPSLAIYAAKSGADARTKLTFGYVGFVILLDGGDVTSYKMDVWPVQVIAKPKNRGDSDPLTIMYQFSIPNPPAEDVAIPA